MAILPKGNSIALQALRPAEIKVADFIDDKVNNYIKEGRAAEAARIKRLQDEAKSLMDINKDIKFINDDLSFLNEEDTLNQSAYILISLQKGDNQYFPNTGIQKDIIGNSKNNLLLPVIFRQLCT